MSTTTTNYGLIKPELTDAANITAFNENWDKLDRELKSRAALGEDGKILPEQIPDVDVSGKVSKTGDILTGSLTFQNTDAYHALHKYRVVNGNTYGMNVGCGVLGGEGVVALEAREGNATDSPLLGRLEIGRLGVSYQNENGTRTYLHRSGAVPASVES